MEVETPEQVRFRYRVAGPGARGVAWVIDAGFRAVVLAIVAVIALVVGVSLGVTGGGIGLFLVVWFLVDWGWYTLFDGLWGGRTPGRAIAGLRVIREDGGPVGWREAILRNLLRPADALPGVYAVGAAASALDGRFRRLGDRVAGTVVIYAERAAEVPDRLPLAVSAEAEALLPPGLRLPLETRQALEGWVVARERLGPEWAAATAERLSESLMAQYPLPGDEGGGRGLGGGRGAGGGLGEGRGLGGGAGLDPVLRMELLVLAGRRTSAVAPDLASARTLTALNEARTLDGGEPGRLVRAYRAVCAELGRLRARLSQEQLAPLEGLAAAGHARLYQRSARWALPTARSVFERLLFDFPAEVRRSRGPVMLAAGLFLVPMIVAASMSAGSPGFVEAVLPVSMRAQMEASYAESIDRSAGENAMMAGFYVYNNVGIALRSVGAGLFLGVGTAWVLVYNGLILGAVMGHLTAQGLGLNLLRFTSGHSAWELTALVLAGAAGLRLGWSLVDTQGMSRAGSLRASGPSVLLLAGGAAAMLGVAAMIEGFWSGQDLPDAARAVFGIANALIVASWLLYTPPHLRRPHPHPHSAT